MLLSGMAKGSAMNNMQKYLYGVLVLAFLVVCFWSSKQLNEAKEEVKKAKEDRDSIVRLAAGGWKFEKPEPADPVDQLERRITYLQQILKSSIEGKERAIKDHAASLEHWDRQRKDLEEKLVTHNEELRKLRNAR